MASGTAHRSTAAPADSARRGTRARVRARVLACACLAALVLPLLAPAVAVAAATWNEGTLKRAFNIDTAASSSYEMTGTVLSGVIQDAAITLGYRKQWEYSRTGVDPASIQALDGGGVLVTDSTNRTIFETSGTAGIGWTYLPGIGAPMVSRPTSAERIAGGNTLICDAGTYHVFEVDASGSKVWEYGAPGVSGTGANQLYDPVWASRLSNLNTLIVDRSPTPRIIEVSPSGTPTVVYATGLNRPSAAQRLPGGGTLITDTGNNRVIEVNGGAIVWSYGGTGKLSGPGSAVRLDNGNTLVADTGNKRVVEIDTHGVVVDTHSTGTSGPRQALRLADGTTLVATTGGVRLYRYGGYAASGVIESVRLDMAYAGVKKTFKSLAWHTSQPAGTGVVVKYAIGEGDWKSAGSSGAFNLPAGSQSGYIRYRVEMSTTNANVTPILKDISIVWEITGTGGGTGSGSGSGSGTGTGSGSGTGTGTGTGTSTTGGTGGVVTAAPEGTGTLAPVDNGVRKGWVMQDVSGKGGGGGSAVGVTGRNASVGLQLGGIGLLLVTFASGFGWSPVANLLPFLGRFAGAMFR